METSKKIESTLPDIPGHLLEEEIFLRLLTPEDLAHTSAACVTFRGLVTDRSFLRRLRRLHTPPVLGFLDLDGFHPALPPHPSAPAAHALTLAADFTFSFLPSHCQWTVQNIRDGRVLLERKHGKDEEDLPIFTELVVCDPLHRWYILLPPVPDDLAASVEKQVRFFGRFWEPSLIPPNEGDTEEAAFRVIWLAGCGINLVVFVFTSSTGLWQAAASQPWRDLFIADWPLYFLKRHFACGCIYWASPMNKKETLVLDTRTMEFSTAEFPPGAWLHLNVAIVDAGEGRLGMFSTHDGNAGDESILCYMVRQNKGESSGQWDMKTISLGYGYRYYIRAATENYLILLRMDAQWPDVALSLPQSKMEFFSLDVKTMQLERMFAEHNQRSAVHIYTNFPPSLLSSPTV